MCVCAYVPTMACVWRSESNLLDSVLSFYSVGSGVQNSVIRLTGKCLIY